MSFVSTSEDNIPRNVHPLCRTISPQLLTAESVLTIVGTGGTRVSFCINWPVLEVSSVKPKYNVRSTFFCISQKSHVKQSHGSHTLCSSGRHRNRRPCWCNVSFHSRLCRSCSTPPDDKNKKVHSFLVPLQSDSIVFCLAFVDLNKHLGNTCDCVG